jgi:Ca2+-binding RTX toxin-like protein
MPKFTGTTGADSLAGGADADTIVGLAGPDTISGGDGADVIYGGNADLFTGDQEDNDLIDGGAGNDVIAGGDGNDTINGGDGNDSLFAGRGLSSLSGGLGNDYIQGTMFNIDVDGGPGDDHIRITQNAGQPVHLLQVSGGDGNDRFALQNFAAAKFTIDGGAGNNELAFSWDSTQPADDSVEIYLNQTHGGAGITALAIQAVSFGALGSASSAHVYGGDLAETISTGGLDDQIYGGAGNDVLTDNGDRHYFPSTSVPTIFGHESIFGGLGNDVIRVFGGSHYLRGDEGDDTITATSSLYFNDINGNAGDDVINGGWSDDWVVGGKDSDQLFGDLGADIVWGNLGNDTCDGGGGNDQVRGGQGNDIVMGGAGNDFVSGDRGDDTVSGGAGADNFHGSQDAGIDRVLDFKLSEGDRVMLDPGTTYTLSQVGADTVIDMGGGTNKMVLVGVQLSTLAAGWMFGA